MSTVTLQGNAFQEALNHAGAGGTVLIPAGTHQLTPDVITGDILPKTYLYRVYLFFFALGLLSKPN